MSDLDKIGERVRQNRAASQPGADSVFTQHPATATSVGGTLVAGDRVFDTVSGTEGNIESVGGLVTGPDAILPVRLDVGGLVVRRARELVKRPTPPAPGG